MMIAARNAMLMGAQLPYDAEIEYLESTGTQWIDTGIVPNGNLSMSVRYMVRAMTAANNVAIYGCVVSGVGFFSGVAYDQMRRRYYYFVNNTATEVNLDFALNTFYDDTLSGTTYTHNAQSATVTAQTSDTRTVPLYARRNASGMIERIGTTRIYSFTLVSGGTLVRDLIPVRVGVGSSAVGYLYDRVSGELFGNAGTGAFVIGPDK